MRLVSHGSREGCYCSVLLVPGDVGGATLHASTPRALVYPIEDYGGLLGRLKKALDPLDPLDPHNIVSPGRCNL